MSYILTQADFVELLEEVWVGGENKDSCRDNLLGGHAAALARIEEQAEEIGRLRAKQENK